MAKAPKEIKAKVAKTEKEKKRVKNLATSLQKQGTDAIKVNTAQGIIEC